MEPGWNGSVSVKKYIDMQNLKYCIESSGAIEEDLNNFESHLVSAVWSIFPDMTVPVTSTLLLPINNCLIEYESNINDINAR